MFPLVEKEVVPVSQTAVHTEKSSYKGNVISLPHRPPATLGRRGGARAVRWLAALVVAGAAMVLILGFVERPAAEWMGAGWRTVEFEVVEVTVRSGDTLWSLAREYGPEAMDIRETVDWIQRENGLSSPVLRPGQRILVPAGVQR